MADIVKQIASLLSVKSIITIILTVVFAMLALDENLSQEFLTIYTVIISFYFGTQFEKNSSAALSATSTIAKNVVQENKSVNNLNDSTDFEI